MILSGKTTTMLSVFIMTIVAIIRADRLKEIKELFLNPRWLSNIIIVIIFSVYMTYTNRDDKKLKDAIKKASLALIIAVLAHIKMTISPFWIVFALAYYTDDWV